MVKPAGNRGFLYMRGVVKNERFCPVFFVKKLFSKINNQKTRKMGGQKRSFFVTIINIKQCRHPVVKRDLVVHDEADEIPAFAGMTREKPG